MVGGELWIDESGDSLPAALVAGGWCALFIAEDDLIGAAEPSPSNCEPLVVDGRGGSVRLAGWSCWRWYALESSSTLYCACRPRRSSIAWPNAL